MIIVRSGEWEVIKRTRWREREREDFGNLYNHVAKKFVSKM